MFQCAGEANFPFKADIYTQYQLQDNLTGQMKRTWDFSETIKCSAKASMSRTSLGEGSFLKPAGVNELTDYVKLRALKPIPLGRMVKNIRNSSGAIWVENDDRTGRNDSTAFEVRGNAPVLGLDGRVLCYEMVLARIDVQ